jgi:hypothetical protein
MNLGQWVWKLEKHGTGLEKRPVERLGISGLELSCSAVTVNVKYDGKALSSGGKLEALRQKLSFPKPSFKYGPWS